MADRVLLTGISGFIGSHVALALLNAGYLVRGSVRDPQEADKARAMMARASATGSTQNLEIVELDLLEDKGWREAAQGCRYLQHIASPLPIHMPKDKNELIAPAVEGTRRALSAALAGGAERIVLTSSVAAVFYGHPPDRVEAYTEADWSLTEGPDVNAYSEAKTRAELLAWSLMEAQGRRHDLAVVNPSVVLGPLLGDDPGTSAMLIVRMLNGSAPAAPRINFGAVDVRDIAALQLAAMEDPGAGGRRYLASAGNITLMECANSLRPAFPDYAKKLPRFVLPDWVVRIYGLFDADVRDNMRSLGVTRTLDSSPAEALLGRPFITPRLAVAATAHSLIERGIV